MNFYKILKKRKNRLTVHSNCIVLFCFFTQDKVLEGKFKVQRIRSWRLTSMV